MMMRTSEQATFSRLHTRVEEVVKGVAASYGCNVDSVEWSASPYPPTVNHADMVDLVSYQNLYNIHYLIEILTFTKFVLHK